ncbi:MAG: arabinofuranosyltransferase, partial [Mycobacteriaceae bacterium]
MGTGTAAGSDEHLAAHSAPGVPAPTDVAQPPRRRRRPPGTAWTTLGLLVLATVVAIVVTVVVQLVAGRLHVPSPTKSAVAGAVTTLALVVVFVPLVASVWMLRTPRWRRAGTVLSWASLSALVSVLVAVPLSSSTLYLNGVSIDQEFRSQFLTRLTDSAGLSDMNYADLKSFYPAGWFWVGGRVGNLLGLDGWEVFKPYAIGSLAVASVVAAVLWSRLLRADRAFLVTIVSTVVGIDIGGPEPYGAMVALVLPPVLVIAWSGLRAQPGPGRRWWPAMLGTGLFLGVTATFYTLYLGLAALTVVVMALLAAYLRRRSHGTAAAVRVLLRLVPAGALSIAIALLVWAPYLLEVLGGGKTDNAAQRYLPFSGAALPLPMTTPTLLGALCLVGTVWILLRVRTSPIAQALGIGVACIYVWFVLSLLALLLHTTLLAFRLEVVLQILLGTAGALGALDGAQALAAAARRRGTVNVGGATVAAAVLGLVGVFAFAQAIPATLSQEITLAYTDANAHGVRADGAPAGDAGFYPQVHTVVAEQTRLPDDQLVVLSTDY